MRSAKLNGSAEINQSSEMDVRRNTHESAHASGALRQVENADDEVAANSLEDLLRRVSEVSTGEIESLIDEFHGVRKKLQTDLSRIQRDIAEYREVSQAVMQLAASISNAMKQLPGRLADRLTGAGVSPRN
jgi:methyl-accepting chemotaxis protein